MSKYRGRALDDIRLWSEFVDFPPGMDTEGPYLTKVRCPNPDHDTSKHHFQINVRDGLVHCFAHCGISGTYEKGIEIVTGWKPKEVRRFILGFTHAHATYSVSRARRRRPAPAISNLAFSSFIPQAGLEYLASRGISSESIARWGIGWDEEDLRIVIPARDLNGQTRFLIRRTVKDREPKYLYTEGFPKSSLLFGGCESDRYRVESLGLILVEGALDAITLHQHGHTNTVATLGTGLSRRQGEIVSMLRPRRIYLFYDRDTAGVRGIQITERMVRGRYPTFVVRFPPGRFDPQECSRKEVNSAIDRALPLRKWKQIAEAKGRYGKTRVFGS